jgi:hypothetical protein
MVGAKQGASDEERSIRIHQRKVDEECAKVTPDEGRLAHWQGELEAFRKQKERLTRRLLRKW